MKLFKSDMQLFEMIRWYVSLIGKFQQNYHDHSEKKWRL